MPVTNVNLVGPTPQQPYDIQAEQAKLALAQKLAQALIDQSIEPKKPGFLTGEGRLARYVPNYGDPVSDIASALIGKQRLGDVQDKQAALAKELAGREAEGFTQYMRTMRGSEPEELPAGEQGPPAPGKAPDFVGAITQALSSGLPGLQKVGATAAGKLLNPEDLLKYGEQFDPKSVAEYYRTYDPSVLKPRGKVTVEGGTAVSTQGEKVLGVTPVEHYGPVVEQAPGIVGQKKEETGKVQFAPTGTVPAKLEEQLNAADLKTLEKGREGYTLSISALSNLNQLRADMAKIPADKFGSFSGLRNEMNKLIELFGGTKLAETAGIEQVQARTGEFLLDRIKALYPVTDKDITIMKGILGSEGMTKRSLEKVVQYAQSRVEREMSQHTEFVKNFQLPQNVNRDQFERRYLPSFKINTMEDTERLKAVSSPDDLRNMSDEELKKRIYGR